MQAEKNPTAFLGLLGKVLPLQVDAKTTSGIKTSIEIHIVDPAP